MRPISLQSAPLDQLRGTHGTHVGRSLEGGAAPFLPLYLRLASLLTPQREQSSFSRDGGPGDKDPLKLGTVKTAGSSASWWRDTRDLGQERLRDLEQATEVSRDQSREGP